VTGYAALPVFFILYARRVLGLEPGLASLWLAVFAVGAGATMVDGRLEVFNVLGQKIKTLHRGELPSQGSYSFTWDGTDNEGNGVASGVYYPIPLHRQPVFEKEFGKLSLPGAEAAAREVLSLPIYPQLADGQLRHVCETLRACL